MANLPAGVFRANDLLRKVSGTYQELYDALDTGHVERLRHGWYATPGADAATVAAVRAGGVLSCVSALAAHGIWVAHREQSTLHVRMSRHAESTGIRVCHAFGPIPSTPTAVDSLPTALACAARCLDDEHWIAAVDSALQQKKLTLDSLVEAWGHTPVWVAQMLDRCDGRAQSGTESITRIRLRANNFRVMVQVWIPEVGIVDLLMGRLIIECDSEEFHGAPAHRRNDYRRDRNALIGRWPVIRIDYDDVMNRWPEILDDIRAITATDLHRRRRRRRRAA